MLALCFVFFVCIGKMLFRFIQSARCLSALHVPQSIAGMTQRSHRLLTRNSNTPKTILSAFVLLLGWMWLREYTYTARTAPSLSKPPVSCAWLRLRWRACARAHECVRACACMMTARPAAHTSSTSAAVVDGLVFHQGRTLFLIFQGPP